MVCESVRLLAVWWHQHDRLCYLIQHPVASEHRWLVKAPRWIHSVPDVSGRRSWRCGCYARLWNLHNDTNAPICKHRFSALPIDKTLSVEAQNGLLWRSFCSSRYRVWINAKDPWGLDSDRWIPLKGGARIPLGLKPSQGFSRHLSAGFTDLNQAPRGLSLYNNTQILGIVNKLLKTLSRSLRGLIVCILLASL